MIATFATSYTAGLARREWYGTTNCNGTCATLVYGKIIVLQLYILKALLSVLTVYESCHWSWCLNCGFTFAITFTNTTHTVLWFGVFGEVTQTKSR